MAKGTCSAPDCETAEYIHGLCVRHLRRMQKHGSFDDPRPTVEERFWAKVDKNGPNGCWLWTGGKCGKGYSSFRFRGRMGKGHLFAFEYFVGPIPEGLEIDHLCRVRHCVNPSHLEAVTHRENVQRAAVLRTHCPQGHPYDEANTYLWTESGRRCRACHLLRSRKRNAASRTPATET